MDNWEFPEYPFPTPRNDETLGSGTESENHSTQTPVMGNVYDEQEDTGYSADSDDPRNTAVIRQPGQRLPKSVEVNIIHKLVRDFLRENGFLPPSKTSRVIPEPPPGPDPGTMDAYSRRHHAGPTIDNLQLNWKQTMNHEWNSRVLQLLYAKFIAFLKEKHLVHIVRLLGRNPVSEETTTIEQSLSEIVNIQQLLYDKLKSRRSKLQTRLKKVNMMPNSSRVEIEAKLQQDHVEEIRRARRYERKKSLYIRRSDTINQKLGSALPVSDRKIWQSIQIIFAHLQQGDISSDETEVEDMFGSPKIVRRIRKPWIAAIISKVMNFVDSQYSSRNPNGSIKRGAPPLRREWSSKSTNPLSQPKPFLPKNFYSSEVVDHVLATLYPKPQIAIPTVPEPRSLLSPINAQQHQPVSETSQELNPNDMDTH